MKRNSKILAMAALVGGFALAGMAT